jgi:DNA-binding response OmpR family regulator
MQLQGARILVVEDEWLAALALETALRAWGCEVVGPVPRIEDAMTAAHAEALDAAVLDANLDGEGAFPGAEMLQARGVPIVLCSGYASHAAVPDAFVTVCQVTKPYDETALRRALEGLLAAAAP